MRAELEKLKTELDKRLADPLDSVDSKFFTGKAIPAVRGATEELRRKSTEVFRENIAKVIQPNQDGALNINTS